MLRKDEKAIEDAYIEERECGHTFCDFDDEQHDMQEIADIIGVDYDYNEEDEILFKSKKDEQRVSDAYDYYLELHG